MKKFAKGLKVQFFIGNNPVLHDPRFEFSKLEKDSSLYLDLEDTKDQAILKILLSADSVELQAKEYRVTEKTFMLDGTALYINVEEKK